MFLKIKILIKPVLLEFSDEDRYYQQIPYSDCEAEFLNMVYDSDIKFDFETYPSSIFVFKNDEFICEYDIKNGILWCSYDKIWRIFFKKYELNDLQITNLIKSVVEEHFKNMEVKPAIVSLTSGGTVEEYFKNIEVTPNKSFKLTSSVVEEHFKNIELTPQKRLRSINQRVEKHFKNMEVTPKYFHMIFKEIKEITVEKHFKNMEVRTDNVGKTYYDKVEEHFNT